jgi:DNA-binding MarR family transcriptional regulator
MTTRSDARRTEALTELNAAFKGAVAAIRRLRGRQTHRPGELSFAQYQLLFGLAKHAELSTGELAQTAELVPATVTQMLDNLEAIGLVERRRSDHDRRIVKCTLTRRGRERVDQLRLDLERRWSTELAAFTTAELATAASVLARLRDLYARLDADPPLIDPSPASAPGKTAAASGV